MDNNFVAYELKHITKYNQYIFKELFKNNIKNSLNVKYSTDLLKDEVDSDTRFSYSARVLNFDIKFN